MNAALIVAAMSCAIPALAAAAQDTRPSSIGTVVVTAERTEGTIPSSVAAVTKLSADDLARTPRATLADILRRAPGFTVIDFDGLGFDPQLMVRGFYGGGEAEYVILLVDGRPVNQFQSGLIAWDVLPPLASIVGVEIVRGGASPLYGDAAIGGVINVITRQHQPTRPGRWDASGGTFGTWRANIDVGSVTSAAPVTLGGGVDRTAGFRDHAERTSARARVGVALVNRAATRLALTARSQWREYEEPGPLLGSLMAADRAGSDGLFRFDETSDHSHSLVVNGDHTGSTRVQLSGSLGAELRNTDAVRTLALAPGFGDTKARESSSLRTTGNVQLTLLDSPLGWSDWAVIGADLSHGELESEYYSVAGGTRDDYAAASGQRGDLDARGDVRRSIGGLYAQYNLLPTDALRLAIGARYDVLRDVFRPELPDDVTGDESTHSAFSPRAGINYRYTRDADGSGNAYVSISRSFKAPTPDQLYDLRSIPVPFPPFAIRTSNAELEPQHGTSVEGGVYHTFGLRSMLPGTLSVSVYQMGMEDELDFDVESFRYVNIGRSRHRGVEAGVSADGGLVSGFANYALQDVTSRSGDDAGKRLKAIPRHTLTGGITVGPWRALETSVLATNVRDVWIDDANTIELPDFTRLDVRIAFGVRGTRVFADVRNLLDRKYASSGFVDPAGTGEVYFYPAAGRTLDIGIRGSW